MTVELTQMPAREEIDLIGRLAAAQRVTAHLVGGGLRDLLLGRAAMDLDFALSGALREVPERFAERVGGTFFWLDEERGHVRVVKKGGGVTITFDFALLRGASIEEDLAERDFTINALAWPLAGKERGVIDPLQGSVDLQRGVIRACTPHSFTADPLRLLRAVRFAATLGFAVEAVTWHDVCRNARLLRQVAAERLRDELFRILAAPGIAVSLRRLHEAGLLTELLPLGAGHGIDLAGADAARHLGAAASQASVLEQVTIMLEQHFPDAVAHLTPYLDQELEGGITILYLMKLAAILTGFGVDSVAAAGRLRLGNKAGRLLAILCSEGGQPLAVSPAQTQRARYRFFRDREPAGPALLILDMATGMASSEQCAELFTYYCRDYPVAEELLLSGDEIMRMLGIGPGKPVGRAMERLREAERRGLINSRADAVAFLEKNLLTNKETIR